MRTQFPQIGFSHHRVRQFLECKKHKPAGPVGAAALEGTWALRCALATNARVAVVFVCPDRIRGPETSSLVSQAHASGAEVWTVSPRVLARLVNRDGPDGVAAIAHLPDRTLDDVAIGPSTSLLVVDGIELPGNLGSIVRCADAAGVDAVILTSPRTRLTHPHAIKASMGCVFSVPVIDAPVDTTIAWLRRTGIAVVAADPAGRTPYRSHHFRRPLAVVVGSERYGLAPAWRDAADATLSIPMRGLADSLNVGQATALLLYEAMHQDC